MRRPSKPVALTIAGAVGVAIIGAGVLAIRSYQYRPSSGNVLSHRPTATATPTATESATNQPSESPTATPSATSSPSSTPTAVAVEHTVPNVNGVGGAPIGYDARDGYPLLVTTDMQAGGFPTWQWDGAGWIRREQSPQFLPQSAPVYDPQLNQTVAVYASGMLGWNGSSWSDMHVASPSYCGGQPYIALDAKRRLLVLLCEASATTTTTWLFDGTRWSQAPTASGPPSRYAAGFAYDPRDGTMVLFGGRSMLGKSYADTWVWDGATWTQLNPPVSPPGGADLLAYDSTRAEMVLLQQPDAPDANSVDREWIWDGSTWSNRGAGPPWGPSASLVDDPAHHDLLLFEGVLDQQAGSQTWRRAAGAWSRIG